MSNEATSGGHEGAQLSDAESDRRSEQTHEDVPHQGADWPCHSEGITGREE